MAELKIGDECLVPGPWWSKEKTLMATVVGLGYDPDTERPTADNNQFPKGRGYFFRTKGNGHSFWVFRSELDDLRKKAEEHLATRPGLEEKFWVADEPDGSGPMSGTGG